MGWVGVFGAFAADGADVADDGAGEVVGVVGVVDAGSPGWSVVVAQSPGDASGVGVAGLVGGFPLAGFGADGAVVVSAGGGEFVDVGLAAVGPVGQVVGLGVDKGGVGVGVGVAAVTGEEGEALVEGG